MRVDGQDLDDLEVAGDHSGSEETLGDEIRVIGVPLLPGQVRVLARGDLQRHHVAGGEPQDDPADEAEVGEPVRDVPEVGHVLRQALLVDHLDVSPEQADLPQDDDGLHVGRQGAPLCPLPVQDQVVQIVIVHDVSEYLHDKVLDSLTRHGEKHKEENVAG